MLLRHPPVAVDDLRRLRFLTVPCQENPSPRMSRCCSAGTHGSTLSRRDILQRGLQSADRCRRSSCQTRATALTPLTGSQSLHALPGHPVDRPIADCAACWNCITIVEPIENWWVRDAGADEDRPQTGTAVSDLGVVGSSDGSEVSTDQRRDVGAALLKSTSRKRTQPGAFVVIGTGFLQVRLREATASISRTFAIPSGPESKVNTRWTAIYRTRLPPAECRRPIHRDHRNDCKCEASFMLTTRQPWRPSIVPLRGLPRRGPAAGARAAIVAGRARATTSRG